MKTFGVALVLLSVVMASELVPHTELLAELKELPMKNNHFKRLLDLTLSQGTKLDQVVQMVEELLQQSKNDLSKDEVEHAQKSTKLQIEIDRLQHLLEKLQNERKSRNQQVQDLFSDIQTLNLSVKSLNEQMEVLGSEEKVRAVRAFQAQEYEKQTAINNRRLDALNDIIEKLTNAVFSQQGMSLIQAEKSEMVQRIKQELGAKHPLALLVEVTSKFDAATVKNIVQRLEHIRDELIAFQYQEEARENEEIENFKTNLQQFKELREKFSYDLNVANTRLTKANSDLVFVQKRIADINKDLDASQSLLNDTKQQKEAYDSQFETNRSNRINEIKTIEMAHELLVKHSKKNLQ